VNCCGRAVIGSQPMSGLRGMRAGTRMTPPRRHSTAGRRADTIGRTTRTNAEEHGALRVECRRSQEFPTRLAVSWNTC
jgi:hypothetical protein